MLHNYHTHTFRNHHTVGTEREYIESAIKNGFQTLGFSEHAPYRFPDGHVSYFHMFPEDLNDYIQTLLTLKAEYASRIEILIGYEAEYYPRFFDDLLARITQYPVDYLLLGQHYIHNEIDGVYVYERTDDPEILKVYVNQCIAGLDTGLYTYLAHPDLFMRDYGKPFDENGRAAAKELCQACKALDIPMEYNLHDRFLSPVTHRKSYPDAHFFEIVRQEGVRVLIGVDAHEPEEIHNPAQWDLASRELEPFGALFEDHLCL